MDCFGTRIPYSVASKLEAQSARNRQAYESSAGERYHAEMLRLLNRHNKLLYAVLPCCCVVMLRCWCM